MKLEEGKVYLVRREGHPLDAAIKEVRVVKIVGSYCKVRWNYPGHWGVPEWLDLKRLNYEILAEIDDGIAAI